MHRARYQSLWAIVIAVTGWCACSPGFEEPYEVLDLRVLAMRAEPPEVLVRTPADAARPIAISILLADPTFPGRALTCRLQSCVLSDINRRCEVPEDTVILAEGPCADGVTTFPVTFPAELLADVQAADPTGGYSGLAVWVELVVSGGGPELHAIKSVVFSAELPEGRTANRNPLITGLRIDDAEATLSADVPWQADVPVRIEVTRAEDAKETYTLPTFEGGTVTLKEYMRFSFYADAGSFSQAYTTDKPENFLAVSPDEEIPIDLFVDWTPPEGAAPEGTPVRFWFVLDDGRGGVDWIRATGRPR